MQHHSAVSVSHSSVSHLSVFVRTTVVLLNRSFAHCSALVKAAILLAQSIKQASTAVSEHTPYCPRIILWNIHLQVHGETKIFPKSSTYICFHALLDDAATGIIEPPKIAAMEDSESEEGDVDILIGRKKYKRQGDKQNLPAAHAPYYPEVLFHGSGLTLVFKAVLVCVSIRCIKK
jgi:hypothetical protein